MNRNRTQFRFALVPARGRDQPGVATAMVKGLRAVDAGRMGFAMEAFTISMPAAFIHDEAAATPVDATFEVRLQRQDPPLDPLDELILLLHTAAEIEHSLMAQYLYAAYSLPDQSPQKEWQETLVGIAHQEMGHLLATQNLLLSVGASLNFEREDYPFSDFYPFPFKLEPLSVASLARYVLAEMPDRSKVPEVDVDALCAEAGVDHQIPRVGALFVAIAELIGELSSDPVFADSLPFQAEPSDWRAGPYALALRKVASITEASQLLDAIGKQGEGPDEPDEALPSHFRRFYAMYVAAKAHVGSTGQPLSDALPTNPTVHDPQAPGYLQQPIARAWGAAFNTRYRILLFTLEHLLSLSNADATRGRMRGWAFDDMKAVHDMALLLKQRPQHEPLRNDELGRARVAGAPFEMPQTLQMPNRPVDRWRELRNLMRFHLEQLSGLERDDDLAGDLSADIRERLTFISDQLEQP